MQRPKSPLCRIVARRRSQGSSKATQPAIGTSPKGPGLTTAIPRASQPSTSPERPGPAATRLPRLAAASPPRLHSGVRFLDIIVPLRATRTGTTHRRPTAPAHTRKRGTRCWGIHISVRPGSDLSGSLATRLTPPEGVWLADFWCGLHSPASLDIVAPACVPEKEQRQVPTYHAVLPARTAGC